jgi:hypothetical protein
MLTFQDSNTSVDCGGRSRRDFLRVGALGLGGLTLPGLLAAQARAGQKDFVRDKSIVFLFCCGGPSHIEMFDPHMDRPLPQRSTTGEVKTPLAGVTFGGTLQKMASRADRMAIVRSYSPHEIADHARAIRHVFTAGDQLGHQTSIGSLVTRIHGESFTPSGVPTFIDLIQQEVEGEYRQDMQRMRVGNGPGALGASCASFSALGGGDLQNNMKLTLPIQRLDDRRNLLHSLDHLRRQLDSSGEMQALDQFEGQAVEMLLGGKARAALDLSQEDPRVVERYDTSQMNSGWTKRRPSTLGKRLLMARRLCDS